MVYARFLLLLLLLLLIIIIIIIHGGNNVNLISNFTFIWPCIVSNFFTIKPTDALISKFIMLRNSTCFGQCPCPSSGVFHCTFGTGTSYTGLTTASVQDQDGTAVPS